MKQKENPYRNVRIEFHILQSFPVTCLNRDDVGAPKTAMIGGTTRARVSSQCWKRQVRLDMHNFFGVVLGTRTKLIRELVAQACKECGANDAQADECGSKIEQVFIKKDDKKSKKVNEKDVDEDDTVNTDEDSTDKTDTLLFLSPKEVKVLAEAFKAVSFKSNEVIKQKDAKKQAKEIADLIGKTNDAIDAFDIALFGRMVAQAATLNVEAATSFSHAISTHKVTNEVDFFTALDDLQKEPGSAHMGSLEFNSATYYRYVSLDVGQLYITLAGMHVLEAVEAFIKALYVAVPHARQATQAGNSRWEFARIFVRKGQRLQVPFEKTVKASNGGFLESSKKELREYLDKKEKLDGSLFGKIKDFDFGEKEDLNIDKLISGINDALKEE